MQYFKDIFSKQVSRIKNIKQGDELYFIFFRISQVLTFVMTVYSLFILSAIAADLPASVVGVAMPGMELRLWLPMIFSSLFVIIGSEVAMRLMDRGKSSGLYLGLLIAFQYCFGFGIIFGMFGLYALLNPQAQRKFLNDAPQWVKDFLSFCRINYLEKEETKA